MCHLSVSNETMRQAGPFVQISSENCHFFLNQLNKAGLKTFYLHIKKLSTPFVKII